MRTIRVLFLRSSPQDHWINRLVSYFDPPFCHVELDFDMSTAQSNESAQVMDLGFFLSPKPFPRVCGSMATSVYSGETVFFRPRTFANPNYTVLSMTVDEGQFRRMFQYCERQARANVAFHQGKMLDAYFSWTCFSSRSSEGTFCSEHVTRVLQEGGIREVLGVDAAKMRPSLLYKTLSQSNRQCFSSVPYKVGLLDKMGHFETAPMLAQH